jgi:hypothetical protein
MEKIRKAYKSLALKWHPDKCQETKDECMERFIVVQKAHAVLQQAHTAPKVPPKAAGTSGGSTCWEAYVPKFASRCGGYAKAGYTCVNKHCAAMNPGGDPHICAKKMPEGFVVDQTTGRCVRPAAADATRKKLKRVRVIREGAMARLRARRLSDEQDAAREAISEGRGARGESRHM